MIIKEVIDKLSLEYCQAINNFDNYSTIRTFIQRALVIGMEHFSPEMEEIIATNEFGVEQGRYKNGKDASRKIGVSHANINFVTNGLRHTAHGLHFTKVEDIVKKRKKLKDFLQSNP
jgi:hypothetical protein